MISSATMNLRTAVIELDVGPTSKCPLWVKSGHTNCLLCPTALLRPSLSGLGNVVRVVVAKPAIAGNHGRRTLLRRLISAVPVHIGACICNRAPGSLSGLRRITEGYQRKKCGTDKNYADHRDSPHAKISAVRASKVPAYCFKAAPSTGILRRRLPVAAKIAFAIAGTMADVPVSPIPPGDSAFSMR